MWTDDSYGWCHNSRVRPKNASGQCDRMVVDCTHGRVGVGLRIEAPEEVVPVWELSLPASLKHHNTPPSQSLQVCRHNPLISSRGVCLQCGFVNFFNIFFLLLVYGWVQLLFSSWRALHFAPFLLFNIFILLAFHLYLIDDGIMYACIFIIPLFSEIK